MSTAGRTLGLEMVMEHISPGHLQVAGVRSQGEQHGRKVLMERLCGNAVKKLLELSH